MRGIYFDAHSGDVCIDGKRWHCPSRRRYYQVRQWAERQCVQSQNPQPPGVLEYFYPSPKDARLLYPPRWPHELFQMNGGVAFDVAKAWRQITPDREVGYIGRKDIDYLYWQHLITNDWPLVQNRDTRVQVDPERAMSADVNLSIPLLIITIAVGEEKTRWLIDGWHRVYKAYHTAGVNCLPYYLFSVEEVLTLVRE